MAKTKFKYYVIMNKRTKRLVSGTNFDRDGSPIQIYADEFRTPLLLSEGEVKFQIMRRKIDLNTFRVIRVDILLKEAENEIAL